MSHITPSLTPDSSEKCETESLLLFVDKGSPPCCPRDGGRDDGGRRYSVAASLGAFLGPWRPFSPTLGALLSLPTHSHSRCSSAPAASTSIFLCFFFFSSWSVHLSSCLARSGAEWSACARPASDRAEQHSPSATAPALARSLGASLAASCAHMHSVPLRSALLQARFLGRSRRPPPRQRRAR